MQFNSQTQKSNPQTISLHGALNAEAMTEMRQVFDLLSHTQAQQVVVDLTHVHNLDASGIGALVFLYKRLANNDRNLLLIGAHGQPESIIRLLRIEKTIETKFLN